MLTDYETGSLILILSGLTAGSAWWSGYNPFLFGIIGITIWTIVFIILIYILE